MIRYGIMQGRLTEPKGRGIQFFPFDNWEREFELASKIGLQEIEWIFDYDDYEKNPIWTEDGCNKLLKVIQRTGVKVHSVCFDYFMRRPFYKYEEEAFKVQEENEQFLEQVFKGMVQIGATLVEIPLVDNSSIANVEEENQVVEYISKMADIANRYGITIGLECDYAPIKFRELLMRMSQHKVVANYDSGNSSGLGYDSAKEISSLNELLYNFHVKDRIFQGTTVKLGTGSADFEKTFQALKDIGYTRAFILQAARGIEGRESEHVSEQLQFVKEYIKKYRIGM